MIKMWDYFSQAQEYEKSGIIKFIPDTPTVNKDRVYFRSESKFVKIDQNENRASTEYNIISTIHKIVHQNDWNSTYMNILIPRPLDAIIFDDCRVNMFTRIPGETIENIAQKDPYSLYKFRKVISSKLILMQNLLKKVNVIHNDIHESNVMYCQQTSNLALVDFENAEFGCDRLDKMIMHSNDRGFVSLIDYVYENARK